jgi:tetratricopeptide (TPR) repeat protein
MTATRASQSRIQPELIKSPIQLLAVWFVALIAINGSFLTAASISLPNWLRATLVLAAVANVPIFLGCMFLLQTRFRPEMQSDEHYAKYLAQSQVSKTLAIELRARMSEAGIDLLDLAHGKGVEAAAGKQVRPLVDQLREVVESLRSEQRADTVIDPTALRALAEGELTMGHWSKAGQLLAEYAVHRPDDFEANFARGVAFANAREGHQTNLEALRAYSDAVATIPNELDSNQRARLFTYRGAMLKRMARYDEALADFQIAHKIASREYEVNDLLYNLASTYALMGDRDRLMLLVRELPPGSPVRAMIRKRLGDYFERYALDAEFLKHVTES